MGLSDAPSGPGLFESEDCWRTIGVWGDVRPRCSLLDEVTHCRNCDVFVSAGRGLLNRPAPAGYLAEWSAALAREKEVVSRDRLSLLAFRIGEEWLAIATSVCREITPVHPARRVPHRADRALRGLVNVRGELLLCISLAELLTVERDPDVDTSAFRMSPVIYHRMIVLEHRQHRWAFESDEVAGVVTATEAELEQAPATIEHDKSSFTTGLLAHQGRSLAVLDHERLFATLAKRIG